MALIQVGCTPPDPGMAFPLPPSFSGLGDDPYGVVNTYPGMPGAPATPSWWQALIGGAAQTAEQVLLQKNLAKGVYTQTGPGGQQITYVQPTGSKTDIFGASSTGITGVGAANSGMGMVLIAGVGVLVLFMVMGRK